MYFLVCFPFTEAVKKAQGWLLLSRKGPKVVALFLELWVTLDNFCVSLVATPVRSFILPWLYT